MLLCLRVPCSVPQQNSRKAFISDAAVASRNFVSCLVASDVRHASCREEEGRVFQLRTLKLRSVGCWQLIKETEKSSSGDIPANILRENIETNEQTLQDWKTTARRNLWLPRCEALQRKTCSFTHLVFLAHLPEQFPTAANAARLKLTFLTGDERGKAKSVRIVIRF